MRVAKRKYGYAIVLLGLWLILLFSNIGHIVAGVTILISIVVLFLCGFLPVKTNKP